MIDFDVEFFLRQYWQQQPFILRNGLSSAIDVISIDELFDLSSQDFVESRLIIERGEDHPWQTFHGPQDCHQLQSLLSESQWTLLVQSTNLWHQRCRELLSDFKFLPSWRLDDIMVSYSTINGTVGAHIDQYDVFLVQVSGRRRWQVGEPRVQVETSQSASGITLVDDFIPVMDEFLEPGDILYIPPNTVHHGVSITDGITLSVGYRAPALSEMMMLVAEEQMQTKNENYYQDPSFKDSESNSSYEINEAVMQQAESWYFNSKPSKSMIRKAFGLLQTQPKQELLYSAPETIIDETLLLMRDPASRVAWHPMQSGTIWLFMNGECIERPGSDEELIQYICEQQSIQLSIIPKQFIKTNFIILLQLFVDFGVFGIK